MKAPARCPVCDHGKRGKSCAMCNGTGFILVDEPRAKRSLSKDIYRGKVKVPK